MFQTEHRYLILLNTGMLVLARFANSGTPRVRCKELSFVQFS